MSISHVHQQCMQSEKEKLSYSEPLASGDLHNTVDIFDFLRGQLHAAKMLIF